MRLGYYPFTLLQLRILIAIVDNGLNVTAAAKQLDMSQPALSRQLIILEQYLGQSLFLRHGKHFQGQTDLCREIIDHARRIVVHSKNILQHITEEQALGGQLQVGTTHTQARYVLPSVITQFRQDYPEIAINIRQGSPAELVRLLDSNHLDIVICTELLENNYNLRTLICFSWNRCLVMPKKHPLVACSSLSLLVLSQYPIITYVKGFTGRANFDQTFEQAGLVPKVMVSAVDSDVIKTYVRLGIGIGVIAEMAYEPNRDGDLAMRPLNHLFPDMRVRLAYQKEKRISASMQRFIELFRQRVDKKA